MIARHACMYVHEYISLTNIEGYAITLWFVGQIVCYFLCDLLYAVI